MNGADRIRWRQMRESEVRSRHAGSLQLRVGEWVEVKSADEILATLDERHTVDGLPFMPEKSALLEKASVIPIALSTAAKLN